MAKIKFSAVVGDARGKVGGNVFSRNSSGAYVRTFASPVNPKTEYQSRIRSRLASLSSEYRALTRVQQQAWKDAALLRPRTDSLGQTYYLTGQQFYISTNQIALLWGRAARTSPPPPQDIAICSIASGAATATTLALTYDLADLPTGQTVDIYASCPSSNGKNFFSKSDMKHIGTYDALTINVLDIHAEYVARYGALTGMEGTVIAIRSCDGVTIADTKVTTDAGVLIIINVET